MIEIKDISKKYGKHIVLDKVNMKIEKGQCVGIVGANGCGKTTLLSIISGMNKADSGSIYRDGDEVSATNKKLSSYISYVPQENPLISELSAMDNLRLWYKGSKKELNKELESGILKFLGIDEYSDKIVSKMSGGMKKRLSIGIALLGHPELLIMDEPSAALDISGKYKIKTYMREFTKKYNGSILVVSHDQNELSICDKLYILKDGKLTETTKSPSDEELLEML